MFPAVSEDARRASDVPVAVRLDLWEQWHTRIDRGEVVVDPVLAHDQVRPQRVADALETQEARPTDSREVRALVVIGQVVHVHDAYVESLPHLRRPERIGLAPPLLEEATLPVEEPRVRDRVHERRSVLPLKDQDPEHGLYSPDRSGVVADPKLRARRQLVEPARLVVVQTSDGVRGAVEHKPALVKALPVDTVSGHGQAQLHVAMVSDLVPTIRIILVFVQEHAEVAAEAY
mmetsp:Transcript_18341/g.50313  ORF Transcript_18341/g.50313 Transcript_18341/m.50313 type:complete len:232 (+) Transcript_18341:2-697(+)